MTTLIRANDPLLQPYKLKHLTLKNRIMSTSHEPNYHEDGMPKEQYRLYHVEKARGGIGLTMTAGSAIVSREMGIPCVVGIRDATRWIETGDIIEVDGGSGRVSKRNG